MPKIRDGPFGGMLTVLTPFLINVNCFARADRYLCEGQLDQQVKLLPVASPGRMAYDAIN